MARIAGVDLPREKRIEISLTYIFGVGRTTAKQILGATGVNPGTKVRELTEDEVIRLRDEIEKNHKVEGDLRREIAGNIKRLVEINCYRGIRHRRGLPCRGQRTRTNARTRKGPKRTVGAKRKK
ncbi:MAG: 30S ribosomal protein S13 [Armatimonadetes bacterium]|nr:30S ribosomal protein S13 [Armatimonadota bacterium]